MLSFTSSEGACPFVSRSRSCWVLAMIRRVYVCMSLVSVGCSYQDSTTRLLPEVS
jgi:hypothetical protein